MTFHKDPKITVPKTVPTVLAKDQSNARLVALMRTQQAALNTTGVAAEAGKRAVESKATTQTNASSPSSGSTPLTTKTRG